MAQQGLSQPIVASAHPDNQGVAFQQGGAGDFGGGGGGSGGNGAVDLDTEDAYGNTGFPPAGTVQPDSGARAVHLNFGKRSVFLGLHQPLYEHMDTRPAKILKMCNVIASILIIIGGCYRLFASFSGPVVQPECSRDRFRDKFCPGKNADQCFLMHNKTDREGDFEHIDCTWILTYANSPGDGFPNFVVAVFLVFYGIVAFCEEVYENTVKSMMTHLHFLATLWGRGLFYLFTSSIVMTHAHTILMLCSSLVMALAFVYILLYVIVEYTHHGSRLGIRRQDQSFQEGGSSGGMDGQSEG
eukprot:CAMPEP_0173419972 /NCGR_PEP_ID=MMETSP1357-20121228/1626_1 /TAXON_ID=77926 /ORGANISM="Hemiselmis rufescens, Strain PCC563" /LENGTH=298 /DNA_ID=CAMNT_0014382707 /DNA_START=33 /DNA_END=925 /DNA_ORIENTATION=-